MTEPGLSASASPAWATLDHDPSTKNGLRVLFTDVAKNQIGGDHISMIDFMIATLANALGTLLAKAIWLSISRSFRSKMQVKAVKPTNLCRFND
jgi:hypothetical protein